MPDIARQCRHGQQLVAHRVARMIVAPQRTGLAVEVTAACLPHAHAWLLFRVRKCEERGAQDAHEDAG
eukprot:1159631-Pelagomonas_calceolata.AAC.5